RDFEDSRYLSNGKRSRVASGMLPSAAASGQLRAQVRFAWYSLREASSLGTVCTEASFPPQYCRSNTALRMIIGRLNPFDADKRPQCRLDAQYLGGHSAGFLVVASKSEFECLSYRF